MKKEEFDLWPPLDSAYYLGQSEFYDSLKFLTLIFFAPLCFLTLVFNFMGWAGTFYLLVASFFLCVLLIFFSVKSEINKENADLSAKLNKILYALEENLPYVLVLRSFNSKLVIERRRYQKKIKREKIAFLRGEVYPTGKTYDDYEYINEHLDDVRQFIEASFEKTQVVFIDEARAEMSINFLNIIGSEENWFDIFLILKEFASALIVIPEPSKSLKQEIDAIITDRHLPKTVFLMPPSVNGEHNSDDKIHLFGLTRRERWESFFTNFRLSLPDYAEDGALIIFDNNCNTRKILPYSSKELGNLVSCFKASSFGLRHALNQLDKKGLLLKTVTELKTRVAKLTRPRLR